jgi:transcriptional regulator with XRE-family HTH domain
MGTLQQRTQLREEAVALRLAGKSVREIKDALGPVGKRTLSAALKGTPPAEWTLRPNAKDDLRERARELRTQGLSYNEIVAKLGVSKSSVSLWVRDLPCPERFRYVHNERRVEGLRKYNEARSARHAAESHAAAAEFGELTDREILIGGAIAYWCEGAKNKPNRKANRVVFINSDAGLITFFLRFLDVAGVDRGDLILRVHIHENADAEAAQRFWLWVTGTRSSQFRAPTLKRHNPKTRRTNVGENYHGCLRIDVRRSAALYRRIEAWALAAMTPGALNAARDEPVSWCG